MPARLQNTCRIRERFRRSDLHCAFRTLPSDMKLPPGILLASDTQRQRPQRNVLLRGGNVLLRHRAAIGEEERLHLLDEELLGLRRPGLKAIFVEQHLLALNPLVPGCLRDILEDLLTEIGIERGLFETLHLLLVANAKNGGRHGYGWSLKVQFYCNWMRRVTGGCSRDGHALCGKR